MITIHMALRDLPDCHHPYSSPGARSSSPALISSSALSSAAPRSGDSAQSGQQPQSRASDQQHTHQPRISRQQQQASLQYANMNIPPAMAQHQRQFMVHWANSLHREGLNRQFMMGHNQIHRAAVNSGNQQAPGQASGLVSQYGQVHVGIPIPPGYAPVGANVENVRGRSSPAPNLPPGMTRTIVREGVSPNGTRWRLVNQHPTGTDPSHRPSGNGGLSAQDVQNILRGADASYTSQNAASAMQRSASNASVPSSLQPNVGLTSPGMLGSRPSSRAATPDPTRPPSYGSTTLGSRPTSAPQQQAMPDVYLLQSPQGPRAILVNGSSGTYFTPMMPTAPASPLLMPALTQVNPSQSPQIPPMMPTLTAANPQGSRRRRAQPAQTRRRGAVARQHNARPMHPRNPGGAALVAQLWPHVWLIMRLSLFVWWFSSPQTSWSRWLLLISIAIFIFILNTGLLNSVVEQVWGPVRRHFEDLVPLQAGPARQGRDITRQEDGPAVGQAGNHPNDAHGGDPNPADMAARLVEQRRQANHNWIQDQVNRVERAALLFLASLAPGIAERHIQNVEREQQRREREQREVNAAAQNSGGENAENVQPADEGAAAGEASASDSGSRTRNGPSRGDQDTGEDRRAQPNPAAVA